MIGGQDGQDGQDGPVQMVASQMPTQLESCNHPAILENANRVSDRSFKEVMAPPQHRFSVEIGSIPDSLSRHSEPHSTTAGDGNEIGATLLSIRQANSLPQPSPHRTQDNRDRSSPRGVGKDENGTNPDQRNGGGDNVDIGSCSTERREMVVKKGDSAAQHKEISANNGQIETVTMERRTS
jgi:hypothetical protein